MKAKIIDCKELANKELNDIKMKIRECRHTLYSSPNASLMEPQDPFRLSIIQVGDNPASNAYIKGKLKDCDYCGIDAMLHKFNEYKTEDELINIIKILNGNGIIVQLPLPDHLNTKRILNAIPKEKDVDGLTEESILSLTIGDPTYIPCTPLACMKIIKSVVNDLTGLHAVVIGRSELVGKPLATLLLQENATVTVCHSKTKDLGSICKQADIVISAVGKPSLVTGDMIKEGAIVIDVGITRGEDNKLHGDIDFDSVSEVAGYMTTVPGGVGLMTRAMLMHNTFKACIKN